MVGRATMHRVAYVMSNLIAGFIPLRRRGVLCVLRAADGKVMLVRHSYGDDCWQLAGGLSRFGESGRNTASRELKKELAITHLDLCHLGLRVVQAGKVTTVIDYFQIEVDPAQVVVASSEIKEVGWFTPELLPDEVTLGALAGIRLATQAAVSTE